MKITVNLKPGAKQAQVEVIGDSELNVWVKEPPKENKANFAMARLLADFYKVPISKIKIVAGAKSRSKLVEVARTS